MLSTRAATWMLTMLITTGSSIRRIATVSTRCGLGVAEVNSLISTGAATVSMIPPPPIASSPTASTTRHCRSSPSRARCCADKLWC